MGLPEHIDLDHNIAIGDSYEDVEYVHASPDKKSSKKENKAKKSSRFAKKSGEVTDRELENLLEVEFDDEVETAEEAWRAVERHED